MTPDHTVEGTMRSQDEIIDALQHYAVIPLAQISDLDSSVPLAAALAEAGLPSIEVALRTDIALMAIEAIKSARPDVIVGAGTVLSVAQAAAAIAAGADYLVAPGSNPSVIDFASSRGVLIIPGVATPSEIEANLERGLEVLKLFPASSVGGPAFLASMRPVYPSARFVPTGGVSPSNLHEYLAASNVVACAGSWISPSGRMDSGDQAGVIARAREALAIARRVRAQSPGSAR